MTKADKTKKVEAGADSFELPSTYSSPATIEFTQQQVDLLRKTICAELTSEQLMLFIGYCKRTKLDPFVRQIYPLVMPQKDGAKKLSIVVAIDGYRVIAERTKEYRGQTKVMWCGKNGVWQKAWLEKEAPMAAAVGVYRKGFEEPVVGIATMRSFGKNTRPWREMPDHMLGKVAESLALRRAFPSQLSGIYTDAEMSEHVDEKVIDVSDTASGPKSPPASPHGVSRGNPPASPSRPAEAKSAASSGTPPPAPPEPDPEVEEPEHVARLRGYLKQYKMPVAEFEKMAGKRIADVSEEGADKFIEMVKSALNRGMTFETGKKEDTAETAENEKPTSGLKFYLDVIQDCEGEEDVWQAIAQAKDDENLSRSIKGAIEKYGKARIEYLKGKRESEPAEPVELDVKGV